MPERNLDARLDAVERALTDGDIDLSELRESADALEEMDDLESRLTDLESRVDELEAGLQAVRGYAGNVRAVNRDVERRASAALAKAETLETAVEDAAGRSKSVSSQQRSVLTDGPEDGQRPDRAAPHSPNSNAGESGRPTTGGNQRRTESSGASRQRSTPRSGAPVDGPPRQDRAHREAPRSDRKRRPDDAASPDSDSPLRSQSQTTSSDPDESAASTDEGDESQTEQFIERVRDAL